MKTNIHIVCLDCPSPPDYGGAIDMFYKIKALHEIGHQITLHYFDYRPNRNTKAIAAFCSAIYAYSRKSLVKSLPINLPFVVQSRINKQLINRLNEDDNPILLEGLHCSGIVPFLKKKERVVVRLHNDEAVYYRQLAGAEKSMLKRSYFLWESRLLQRYQKSFNKSVALACLSFADQQRFEKYYDYQQTVFIPAFLPWQEVTTRTGKGDYCLYHGNLTIAENEKAAHWLLTAVFPSLMMPSVIAGKGISKKLNTLAKKLPNVRLVESPPTDELDALIKDAHIHLLPSLNATGVKIKLLHALFNGRYCITNSAGVEGSGLTGAVLEKNTPEEWIAAVEQLMEQDFSAEGIDRRKKMLSLYDNRLNALKLSAQW